MIKFIEKGIDDIVIQWLTSTGLDADVSKWLSIIIVVLGIAILSFLADFIARKIILTILNRIAKKTKTLWDDILFERKVFNRLSHLAPAIVIFSLAPLALLESPGWINFIQILTRVYMIFVVLLVLDSFLNAMHDIYNTFEVSKKKPIKGYIQVVKIVIYFIGAILIFAILMNKSPWAFLGGLGAMSAVLLLVFKDSIMGFVAGIQLSANDLVRPGDWISMPKYNADGTVLEITLNTVKVQNWDKTIASIPTYALISDSFSNWRGMEESGGRRIKRAVTIDMNSIHFCSEELLVKLKKINLLKPYIESKLVEIENHNNSLNINKEMPVNGRKLTNIGVFRKYVEFYVMQNPNIKNDMTFLVRQLEPTEKGLPIEIYAFSKVQAWAEYEAIQADIFDHLLSVIPNFELRVFQNPTGSDFLKNVFNK